jgi:hypothetical protein
MISYRLREHASTLAGEDLNPARTKLLWMVSNEDRVRLISISNIYFGYAFLILYKEYKIHVSFRCGHLQPASPK